MPDLFDYLIHANIAIIVFGSIGFLMKKFTTFFTLNRYLFLFGLCFSFVCPFLHINQAAVSSQITGLSNFFIAEQLLHVNLPISEKPGLSIRDYCELIYWFGLSVFVVRLIIQLFSLRRLYQNSTKGFIRQYPVRAVAMDIEPFSFCQTTFINPLLHTLADTINILEHEHVHIRQWHFIDVLFCELLGILFWFNPFMIMVKKSICENLEFITDKSVLDTGINSKNYQYSLIKVGLFKSSQLGNYFNSSTIKNRIAMINAKKTSKILLALYFILIPGCCVALLMLSSATTTLSTTAATLSTTAANFFTGFQPAQRQNLPIGSNGSYPAININGDTKPKKRIQKMVVYEAKATVANTTRRSTVVYFINDVNSMRKDLPAQLINHLQHLYVLTPDQFKAFSPKTFQNPVFIAIAITDDGKDEELNKKLSSTYRDRSDVISKLKTLNREFPIDTLEVHKK